MKITSTWAFIIYAAALLAGLIFVAFHPVSDAVVIAYFTNFNAGFIAYITRRYYKHKLNNEN